RPKEPARRHPSLLRTVQMFLISVRNFTEKVRLREGTYVEQRGLTPSARRTPVEARRKAEAVTQEAPELNQPATLQRPPTHRVATMDATTGNRCHRKGSDMARVVTTPPSGGLRPDGTLLGGWWHDAPEGERIVCDLCPRECSLKPGDRGFCFVRQNLEGEM